MRKPETVKALEQLGRVRLSKSFFMREFLHSEISNFYGIPNIPDDPDLAIRTGRQLCEELLEPLVGHFGKIVIRSSYRSRAVNEFGSQNKLGCSSNEKNAADHIWDMRDEDGCIGATACIVVPGFADRFQQPGDWKRLAWWIHDHLPYASMVFFPKRWAVNLQWHERPVRRIDSWLETPRCMTKPGMENHEGRHDQFYEGLPQFDPALATQAAVSAPVVGAVLN